MSTYSMDHSTYYKSSASPETKMESLPDTDLYTTTGWSDAMFMPGTAPFSPVLSDTNRSAYTLATSDVSFPSLGPSVTQEVPAMDSYLPTSWSAESASNNFFAEPAVESEMFSFPAQVSDAARPSYNAWYTPTEATTETYFAMESQGQPQAFAQMIPQTAGFVGTPFHMANSAGYSNPGFHAGHVRVDSLYSQTSPQDVAVSLNSGSSEAQIQDAAGPRRMTVPVTSMPVQTAPSQKSEQDVPYGAPIQQYRTYAPSYSNGSILPYAGPQEVPVLGSNVSVSSASSIAPSGYEESPCSPAASTTTTRTRAEENDGRARTDPLYSARARGDGYYHCPFVASEGCQHKPTKLKCNYDKYIDSHIKPFRCKHQNCNNNRFSSTACLLRHEREAHGLHGHGNKPFLCEFKDCDRSSRDNGFPRAYNLLDHMKRVHGYRPEKATKTPPAQNAGRSSGKSQDKVKKRKTTGEATHLRSSSAVKKEAISPRIAQKLAADERKQQMTAQWQARVNELQLKLQRVQHPSDLQQVSQELAELQQLSRQFG